MRRLLRGLLYLILGIYAAAVIYPVIWLVISSVKTDREIFDQPWGLPAVPQWANFARAWAEAGIGRYFVNSVLVTAVSLFFILLFSAMAAYVLARFRFRGNEAIYSTFLAGMMFPIFLGIVPLFLLLNSLTLLNTYHGLILVYIAYSLSFTVFVLTAFFRTIPGEVMEAGLMDGCSHFGVFFRVMLPMAKPGLVTAGIFNFFGLWNEYPLALVIMTSDELRTLPVGIANLVMVQQYQTDWGALLAALTMVLLPALLAYSLWQKRIVEGISMGAVKG